MKIAVMRESVLPVIEATGMVVHARNRIPILGNYLLSVRGGKLHVATTDMDMVLEGTCPADGDTRDGSVTVNARVFAQVVKELPEGARIELEAPSGEEGLRLCHGLASFIFATLPASDFPGFPTDTWQPWFATAGTALSLALGRVRSAISTEETRYYLNGIYLHNEGAGVRFVATDGHRLGMVDATMMQRHAGPFAFSGVIVPSAAVRLLAKLAHLIPSVEVKVSPDGMATRWEMGNRLVLTRSIDGIFPDYRRVIPANGRPVTLPYQPLVEAVRRVATMAPEKSRAVKLAFGGYGKLDISSSHPKTGAAKETVEGVAWQDDPLELGFNAQYLADTLSLCAAKHINARFGTAADPAVFAPADDDSRLGVLMPMRI